MKKTLLLAAFALLLFSCSKPDYTGKIPKGFDEYCQKTVDDWKIPAMSVVVVKDGKVVFLEGYGQTKLDGTGVPVDPHTTQFVLASTTKAFTGALLATVIDEYDVDWNDPVTKHLPDFKLYDPWATRNMTVKEINAHHTGFKSYAMDDLPIFGYDRDDLYHLFSVLQPSYSFRSKYAYNNETYTISAKIIEKYTGLSWDDAIAERIFKPLKMVHSTTGNKEFTTSPDLASGYRVSYDKEADTLKVTPRLDKEDALVWLSAVAPAAFVMTTAEDMGNWLKMHLGHGVFEGDTVISRKNHDYLFYPQTVTDFTDERVCTYGQGWTVEQSTKCRYIRHTGLAYGYTSLVGFVPELDLGFAFLSTDGSTNDGMAGCARQLIDMYLGQVDKDWEQEYFEEYMNDLKSEDEEDEVKEEKEPVKALPNSAYVGMYRLEPFGTATVYENEGKLFFNLKKVDSELEHKDGNVFVFNVPGAGHFDLTFTVSGQKARSLTFDINDPIGEFTRL